jgi:hypothetical protein
MTPDPHAGAEAHIDEKIVSPETPEGANGGVKVLNLVRGYVLLVVGVGLIVWSFLGSGPVKAGALTMGGALIGFNPLFRATVSAGAHR